jgi:hypothetical protein
LYSEQVVDARILRGKIAKNLVWVLLSVIPF